MEKKMDYTKIPKEKFAFYQRDENIHDKKLDTKPVGYFRDAMGRFARNKSSVAAAVIIALLILYAVIIPYAGGNKYTNSPSDTMYLRYANLLPKSSLFDWAGWDGCTDETLSKSDYYAIAE